MPQPMPLWGRLGLLLIWRNPENPTLCTIDKGQKWYYNMAETRKAAAWRLFKSVVVSCR